MALNALLKQAAPKMRDMDEVIELRFSGLVETIGNEIRKQIASDKKEDLFRSFRKKRELERKQPIKDERFLRKLVMFT